MRLLVLTYCLFLGTFSTQAQDNSIFEVVSKMARMDQHQRMRVAEAIQEYGVDAPQVRDSWERIVRMDSIHFHELRSIHEKVGFGRFITKGGQYAHNLWMLMMHQDDHISLQEELLKVMKTHLRRGNVILRDLAFLEDRIAVNKGQLQPYATQTYLDAHKHKYLPFDYDPEGVKERRNRMALKPLKKQLKEENKRHKVKF